MPRSAAKLEPRTLAALLLAALALLLAAATPAVAQPATPSKHLAAKAEAVARYWTPARMRAAEPAEAPAVSRPGLAAATAADASGAPQLVAPTSPGAPAQATLQAGSLAARRGPLLGSSKPVADPSAPGIRAHGKVFFRVPGEGDFVCSGTAVTSRNRSVVWTAGHCVFDAGPPSEGYTNRFSTDFIFVPAYRDGRAPFGEWVARRLATTPAWRQGANLRYDLGAAVVRRRAGRRLQWVVGARGIGFNQPRGQALAAFGYPQQLPFDGRREYRCDDVPVSGDPANDYPGPAPVRIDCDMTAGSSGGGWVVGATLFSVTSYGYADELNHLYGPYMSGAAKVLYKSVRGRKRRR